MRLMIWLMWKAAHDQQQIEVLSGTSAAYLRVGGGPFSTASMTSAIVGVLGHLLGLRINC